jgi:hypothetical protein
MVKVRDLTPHDVSNIGESMPQAVGGNNAFPSLEDVANLVRSLVNDDGEGATGTPGEGQIVVDNSPSLTRFLNSAIGEMYRELRNVGTKSLIADNYIVENLPVLDGPYGSAAPAPETQVSLGYTGFFDGTQMWPNLTLPINMLMPVEVWQRQTGSEISFSPVPQAQGGLPPAVQGQYLGQWEWRSDAIWFNGALTNCDIRIRYQLKLPMFAGTNIAYASTYIPIQDCVNAVAYKVAAKYAMRLNGPETAAAFDTLAKAEMLQLRNEQVRRQQSIDYNRQSYDSNNGTGGTFGYGY